MSFQKLVMSDQTACYSDIMSGQVKYIIIHTVMLHCLSARLLK